jgi:hypothetical protein
MNLAEVLALWTNDGFTVVQMRTEERTGYRWYLYHATAPYECEEYGRHLAFLAVENKKTKDIIHHDFLNLTGDTNYSKESDIWFDRHVREGL